MCGIFGIICGDKSAYGPHLLSSMFTRLALYSESRGKESCGFAFNNLLKNEIKVFKGAVPVSEAIKGDEYNSEVKQYFNSGGAEIIIMGHSRLVTNGSQLNDENNQPVIKSGIIAVHNGIITNTEALWNSNKHLKRDYIIDTEVYLALAGDKINKSKNITLELQNVMSDIKGTISAAMIFSGNRLVYLATNNGSLYILTDRRDIIIFASEKNMLQKLISSAKLKKKAGKCEIMQVKPRESFLINPLNISTSLNRTEKYEGCINGAEAEIICRSMRQIKRRNKISSLADINEIALSPKAAAERKMLEHNYEKINKLKRCSKCILPETFPFIEFDEKGVCNYCRGYVLKNMPKPENMLWELVAPYRNKKGEPECIVPYSGGRDSTFVLHTVKKELGLNPVAFTYDWGMVTDLARRNIARVCGKLGVENIIVSADIHWKRKNIQKNILAWLKKPDLGMVPLFMAGDKYFFYYTQKVKEQTGIKLNIWGINPLENTDFKVGFAGIAPEFNKKRIYSLNSVNQIKMIFFVLRNMMKNPSYINQSVFDTFGSYIVRYFFNKKDYYHLFDYYKWDEKMIEATIMNEYEWETASDTKSTWRIGDGTASFYNYLYYNIAGFSENDTFRSNQIREGMISREEALKKAEEENKPRYETIKWYFEILGLDFEPVIKHINKIPKLYIDRV